MSTPELLKEEINQTLSQLHDLAKWKLIAVSGLAVVGLGLSDQASGTGPYWLLLFVPFACAYVDLHCYQYLLRVFAISKHLRESSDDELIRQYEEQCEKLRTCGYFDIGMYAQLGSSIGFSLILPGIAVVSFLNESGLTSFFVAPAMLVWMIGILFVLGLYFHYRAKERVLDSAE